MEILADAGLVVEIAENGRIACDKVLGAGGGGFASVMALREVGSREEALHLMELACAYYEQHEPSSPLPLLIRRAQRLADKNFLDILRDLAPDGVHQAQMIAGMND